jgi:DNA-binding IclR family transcriptional regulator
MAEAPTRDSEIVQEARRHFVSRAISNPIPGVNAFSAPVFDLEGNPVMVITMTNHENRLPAAWKNEAVSMLVEAVKELTARLGGQQPAQA